MFKKVVLTVLCLLAAVQYGIAHDLWLEPKDGALFLAYGHGADLDSYDANKVKDIKATDCDGAIVPTETTKQKAGVSISFGKRPSTVTLFLDGGYFVKTTEGWKDGMTKREAQGKYSIVESLKSHQYAKALLTPCARPAEPVGAGLEIVPQKDPFSIRPGEPLPLRVLMDGKPMEGAGITYRDIIHSSPKSPKTDKEGLASIVIESTGFQLINAWKKIPIANDPDADTLFISASLTFEVK